MTARDPRLDPREGDVTKNRDGVEFYVRDACRWTVTYQEYGTGELLNCDISEWRQWAEHDTVMVRGGE